MEVFSPSGMLAVRLAPAILGLQPGSVDAETPLNGSPYNSHGTEASFQFTSQLCVDQAPGIQPERGVAELLFDSISSVTTIAVKIERLMADH